MLDLCNHCLLSKNTPDKWSTSSVAMLFKKGDPADANNCRPICLLSIAYKLFASFLNNVCSMQELKIDFGTPNSDSVGGMEQKTQFSLHLGRLKSRARNVMVRFVSWPSIGKRPSTASTCKAFSMHCFVLALLNLWFK